MISFTTLPDLSPPVSPTGGEPLPPAAVPGAPLTPAMLRSGTVATATPGMPSGAPSAGPETPVPAPAPGPGPGPVPSGSGPAPMPTPNPSPTPAGDTSGSDAFAATAAASFFDLIHNASSPDALEAQNIILRRIALEGDVVPSRVPAPRNITEIGGYFNLLTEWNELDMRSQVLAGILGVAGPNPALGWTAQSSALSYRPLINDRPAGAGQAALPVTVMVRSDFFEPLTTALDTLHEQGGTLPLMSGPLALPAAGTSGTVHLDPLDYIGRILRLASGQALVDPATDALALVRATGDTGPFGVASRVLSPGSVAVAPADYDALQQSGTALATVPLAAAAMIPVMPILSTAGFAIAGPTPTPGAASTNAWARFVNIGGLAGGQTKLGEELALLYSRAEIAASAFAGMQNWVWNGIAFAP